MQISGGEGYAQYGSLPFICESDFHITRDEFERRKRMPWPNREPGTFIPDEHFPAATPPKPDGPVVTTEVIGESPDGDDDLFPNFLTSFDQGRAPRRKNGRDKR